MLKIMNVHKMRRYRICSYISTWGHRSTREIFFLVMRNTHDNQAPDSKEGADMPKYINYVKTLCLDTEQTSGEKGNLFKFKNCRR